MKFKNLFLTTKSFINYIRLINFYADKLSNKDLFINKYNKWLEKNENINLNEVSSLRKKIKSSNLDYKFSIVMPVYNPDPRFLKEAIESVIDQIYQNWELCIADDASTNPEIKLILDDFEKKDKRIKVIYRKENGHISKASNSALSICNGNYIGFLDHDDTLSKHALLWTACEAKKNPKAQIFYSDEDKIDETGRYDGPYFKPDFSPELFYSHNLITHFAVYKKKLVMKVKGFRSEFNGAQDYDFALRALSYCGVKHVCHIPKILYHWRQHSGSTALDSGSKPYAMIAGEKALNQYFKKNKISYTAKHIGHAYKLSGSIPKILPKVSVIIPSNNIKNLSKCIKSIFKNSTYTNYEIIVMVNGQLNIGDVDNLLAANKKLKIFRYDGEFNYSRINNTGAKYSSGDYLLFLNDDIQIISNDWIETLLGFAKREDIGAVGLKLLYSNDTIQHGGVVLGINDWAGHAFKGFPKNSPGSNGRLSLVSNFSAITAACLMVSKLKFNLVRGFNDRELKVACNDVDFCLKLLSRGLRNVYCGHASLYHYESISRGYEDTKEKKERFLRESDYVMRKWNNFFEKDPFYNPNLTINTQDFDLAENPRIEKFPKII